MKKIGGIIAVVVLLVIFGLYSAYSSIEYSANADRVTLNVSTEGPIELSKIIADIQKRPAEYDNETLKWMESLGSKDVFTSPDAIVIMDSSDSGKLHSEFATDVSITQLFSCKIIEKHTLRNNDSPKEVIYVEDVEFIKQEIKYYDV